MMQRFTISILLLFHCFIFIAQSNDPVLYGTGGNMVKEGPLYLSYSFGEPLISTSFNQETWITEGFQQPDGIDLTTSIGQPGIKHKFIITPNPAREWISLSGNEESCRTFTITNLSGINVREGHISKAIISTADLIPGFYFITLICDDQISTQSFFKL